MVLKLFKRKEAGQEETLKKKPGLILDIRSSFQLGSVKRVTSIEVGGTAVRVLTLSKKGEEAPKLEGATQVGLPTFKEKPSEEELYTRQIEALKSALKKHPGNLGTVVTALERPVVVIREIEFPSLVDSELAEMLEYDAARHIPFILDEAEWDWSIISKDTSTTISRVMLVAAKKEELEKHLSFFVEAGIQPDVIDVDILGTSEAYAAHVDPEEHIAIFDFGYKSSRIGIVHDGMALYSRGVMIGGEQFFQEDPHGDSGGSDAPTQFMFNQGLGRLAIELKRTLSAYQITQDQGGGRVNKLFLCGELSTFPQLDNKLESELGIPVKLVDPGKNLFPHSSGMPQISGPDWAPVAGLVARTLEREDAPANLLPHSIREANENVEKKGFMQNLAALAVLFVVFLIIGLFLQWDAKMAVKRTLEDEIASVKPKIEDLNDKSSQLEKINGYLDNEHSIYKVLLDLYTIFPDNAKIKYLVFQKKEEINLQGHVFTDDDQANLISILREEPLFDRRGVKWEKTYRVRIYQEKVLEYTINCLLKSNPIFKPKPKRTRKKFK